MISTEESISRVTAYYAAQAPEYHAVCYETEEADQTYARLKGIYRQAFRELNVIEIAAGSGYWTEAIAAGAQRVLATDASEWHVDSIRKRLGAFSNVQSEVADAYSLESVTGRFTAAFAQHWWSHIPVKRQRAFLDTLHSKLQPGAFVLFGDNLPYFGEGVNRRTDEHGDLYEERFLRDGSRFETIKNFPTEAGLRELLNDAARDLDYRQYEPEHLWVLSYRLA